MKFILSMRKHLRVKYFTSLWSKNVSIIGKPIINQPLLIKGEGKIIFEANVNIGYNNSQEFLSTYAYFDLRGENSLISIGEGVYLNNNTCLTADEASIHIGRNTVAGVNLSVQTSDGHSINPTKRFAGNFPRLSVTIGENVFIGDNVIILKGVNIGKNTVIGAGSVVTSSIPENVMAAGNPCKVIRPLS